MALTLIYRVYFSPVDFINSIENLIIINVFNHFFVHKLQFVEHCAVSLKCGIRGGLSTLPLECSAQFVCMVIDYSLHNGKFHITAFTEIVSPLPCNVIIFRAPQPKRCRLFYWQINRKWTDMATITQPYRPALCSSDWPYVNSLFFAEDEL